MGKFTLPPSDTLPARQFPDCVVDELVYKFIEAIVRQTWRDAKSGDVGAKQWLVLLQAARPKGRLKS